MQFINGPAFPSSALRTVATHTVLDLFAGICVYLVANLAGFEVWCPTIEKVLFTLTSRTNESPICDTVSSSVGRDSYAVIVRHLVSRHTPCHTEPNIQ